MTDIIEPVVQGLGFQAADVSCRRAKGLVEVHLVLAKLGGITLDDCALVHSTVLPKLELEYPDMDIRMEVSSPGIHRVIKSVNEFPSYRGMSLSVLPENSEEWIKGILLEVDDIALTLETAGGKIKLDTADIRKAKLDSMEEAEK